jgi:hypothetical protein
MLRPRSRLLLPSGTLGCRCRHFAAVRLGCTFSWAAGISLRPVHALQGRRTVRQWPQLRRQRSSPIVRRRHLGFYDPDEVRRFSCSIQSTSYAVSCSIQSTSYAVSCSMVEKYGIEEKTVMTLICACCVPCSYYQLIFEVPLESPRRRLKEHRVSFVRGRCRTRRAAVLGYLEAGSRARTFSLASYLCECGRYALIICRGTISMS